MELSKRLRAVADLVTAGYQVADIGTDHAYIPIFLTETGKTDYAVAIKDRLEKRRKIFVRIKWKNR